MYIYICIYIYVYIPSMAKQFTVANVWCLHPAMRVSCLPLSLSLSFPAPSLCPSRSLSLSLAPTVVPLSPSCNKAVHCREHVVSAPIN